MGEHYGDLDAKEFQFTLPRGERQYLFFVEFIYNVSIHAPARGATGILLVR